jgi:hypothetical protein
MEMSGLGERRGGTSPSGKVGGIGVRAEPSYGKMNEEAEDALAVLIIISGV